jgi:N-ethylmaleimide reductase
MLEYYRQRASAGGLIITESTHVPYDGRGHLGAPGICENSRIPGWKKIADTVRAKGGRIFMQLGHDGRQSSR